MVFDVFTSGEGVFVNDPMGLFLEASKGLNAAASSSTKKANTDADIIDQLKRRAGGRLMCAHANSLVCACTDFDSKARGWPEGFLATIAAVHACEAAINAGL